MPGTMYYTCSDSGMQSLFRVNLKKLSVVMPNRRREGLIWALKAFTALTFLATQGVADAVSLSKQEVAVSGGALLRNEPDTRN